MRKRWLELALVVAAVALMAWWLRPAPAPKPAADAPDPGFDAMVMAVGEVPAGLLERMRARLDGPLRVVVGLPYLNPIEPAVGELQDGLLDMQIMPQLESQAQVLGARKIGVTSLPLESYRALMDQLNQGDYSSERARRIVFVSEHAAILSTHGMPDEERLFRLAEAVLQGRVSELRSWEEFPAR